VKQVTINSVTYNSLAAAWRDLSHPSVSFALARKRVSRGWNPKRAIVTPVIDPVDRRRSTLFVVDSVYNANVPIKKTGFEI